MHTDEILDNEFSQNFQKYLFEKEGMIWEGEPNPRFRTMVTDIITYENHNGSYLLPVILLTLWLVMVIFDILLSSGFGSLKSIVIIIIGIALLAPGILKHIRKRQTKYAFTRNRVFFQLWRWGKKSIHYIDLADVAQIIYDVLPDKSGTIHFLPIKPFDFRTYDFVTGEMRFYPTFEMVPNVIELYTKLEALRQERIKF